MARDRWKDERHTDGLMDRLIDGQMDGSKNEQKKWHIAVGAPT